MEKIKKYWKEILIGILLLFSLNKCTTSCSRGTVIKKQNIEIVQKDSVIRVQADSLNILKIRWADAQNSQSTYQGIALGTKQTLIDSINIIKAEKNVMYEKLRQAEAINKNLKNEVANLKKQLNGK